MKTLRKFLGRCAGFWRRGEAEDSLREEIEAHLEMETEALVAQGMEPARAREEARRRFGHVEGLKEQCREQSRIAWLEQWGRDVGHSARALLRLKGYSLSVILVLALGIASLATVLNIAQQLLFPVTPFFAPERTMEIQAVYAPGSGMFLQQEQYLKMSTRTESLFECWAAHTQETENLILDEVPFPLSRIQVTPRFFDLCRVQPVIGRLPLREEWERADGSVVLISHGVWTKRFARDPGVLGRKVRIGKQLCEVIGVLPKEFYAPRSYGLVWDLVTPSREELRSKEERWNAIFVYGRAKPGVPIEQLRTELALSKASEYTSPDMLKRLMMDAVPVFTKYEVGSPVVIWCMLGAALLLHGIALINVCTLVMVRLHSRRRELGMRLILGGSQTWVRHLVVSECLLLGLGSLAPALVLSQWAGVVWVDYVNYWWFGPLSYQPLPLLQWCLLVWILSLGLLGGLVAWLALKTDSALAFREGQAVAGHSKRGRRMLDGVVVLQTTLAVALLVGAGLMLKSMDHLHDKALGFDTHRKFAITGSLARVESASTMEESRDRFLLRMESVRAALSALPEAGTVEIADLIPLTSMNTIGDKLSVEGGGVADNCLLDGVSPGFFQEMHIRLLKGAAFSGARGGDPELVLSESCAKKLFGERDPIGAEVDMGDSHFWGSDYTSAPTRVRWHVRGVVADVCMFGQRSSGLPVAYFPYWQRPLWNLKDMGLVLQTRIDTDARFEESIRKTFYQLDPQVTVSTVRLEQERVWKLNNERYAFMLLRVLSGLAVVLTLAGVYSVMSYSVQQRQREFGVRIALGARAEDLRNAVLWRGGLLAGLGIGIGLGLAWYLSRFLEALLFEVGAFDMWVYLSVGLGLFAVALLSSWIPARRALRIDPVESLRAE